MTLHGVFIGIDDYPPPATRLTSALNDATALHALFSDTVAGELLLLTDSDATGEAIAGALESLADTTERDTVLVTFSGHGTPEHYLLPADVDPEDVEGTGIHLDDLAGFLDRIPASRLVVILDCCFSGGFGGERSFAPNRARAPFEDVAALERLGRGRYVVTACRAGEAAYESSELGHGLLTQAVLDGLQGAAAGRETDTEILVFELLDWVTREVARLAERIAVAQTPTVYGSFEGALRLPKLIVGDFYAQAFPRRAVAGVTNQWTSLLPFGIPSDVVDAWASEFPDGLNQLQTTAINDFGLLADSSLLTIAPTSSGKTLLGELAGVKAAASGGRSIFLLPLKALVNEKYEEFQERYGARYGVARATGDYSDDVGAILSGHYDIAILTYEKFTALALGSPHVVRGVGTVVVDEAQMLADQHRGAGVEFLLTLLQTGHGRGAPPQLVCLSAVIGGTNGLEDWLGAGLLRWKERPVPLIEAVVDSHGNLQCTLLDGGSETITRFASPEYGHGGSAESKPTVIGLVRRLVDEGKKVIVFRSFRGQAMGAARYLASALALPPATHALEALPPSDGSNASDELRQSLQAGVAFHTSDLSRDERAAVEAEFRSEGSDLSVIASTSTLAMGLNTPADAVLVCDLVHPGNVPYLVSEYKNMAGRAGRIGFASEGESYLVATGSISPTKTWERYVLGEPEALVPRLFTDTDIATVVLRVVRVFEGATTRDEVADILAGSFAAHYAQATGAPTWTSAEINAAIERLCNAELATETDGDISLTALGDYAAESGLEVESMIRIATAIGAHGPPISELELIVLAQNTVELDNVLMPVHKRSVNERTRWIAELGRLGVRRGYLGHLSLRGGEATARAKRAVSTVRFIDGRPMSEIEREVLQHVRERDAAGAIRNTAERTRDVLFGAAVAADLIGASSWTERVDDLALQLELGVPSDLLPLARECGTTIARRTYLSLRDRGVLDADGLLALSDERALDLLGDRAGELRAELAQQRLGGAD